MRGSPKGARRSGELDFKAEERRDEVQKERAGDRLDFEAEGRHEEVQKERERAEDWTLKWRGGRRKSKRSEQEWQIGL